MTKKKRSRDPLMKYRILSQAGESLGTRLEELLVEKVMYWFVVTLLVFLLFFMDLYRYYFNTKPTPWFWLIVTIGTAAISYARIRKILPEIKAIKQGMKGERAVADLLEDLRGDGYRVFHDVATDGHGNVDHVVIGPAGVFALETKTLGKPADRHARIVIEGGKLLIDGKNPSDFGDRDPMDQAKTSAACIREILKSCSGRTVQVRPVLLFPGWWVDERPELEVLVIAPERVFAHLRSSRPILQDVEITHLSENLRRVLSDAKK